MPQRESPTSETPKWTTFDVDARKDQAILEVLCVATLGRVKQLLEEYTYWNDNASIRQNIFNIWVIWSNWEFKQISIILRYIEQHLEENIFDCSEYGSHFPKLPKEIRDLVIRTAYICGKATGSIGGNLSRHIRDNHIEWFNYLISRKDTEDLTGVLIRFETHGRIEKVLSVLQAYKESQVMPTSLDWKIIYDHIDLFYTICEEHGISEEEAELFLDTFSHRNY